MLQDCYAGLGQLLYPDPCAGCGGDLPRGMPFLCIDCYDQLPFTHYHRFHQNPVEKIFWGRLNVYAATACLYFNKQSAVQHLLHRLKYKGEQEIGPYLGRMLAAAVKKDSRFDGVEALIPMPLYYKKEEQRGYNQSVLICEGLSRALAIPVLGDIVIRSSPTQTQARKARPDRWQNVEGRFELTGTSDAENKHLLLVDDVLTTGATMEACGMELLQIKGATLSIAVLAQAIL